MPDFIGTTKSAVVPNISKYVLKHSKEKRVNYRQLCDALNVSSVVLGRILRGEKVASIDKYIKLEKALEIKLSDKIKDKIKDKISEKSGKTWE